jgi:hypothetical protein
LSVTDKIVSIIGAEDSESEEEDNNVNNLGDQHFEIGMNTDDDIQINLGQNDRVEDPTPKIIVKCNRVGKYHKMIECEREFILKYASLPSQYITKGPKSQQEYIKNLIYIINHFMDYGFNL